MWETSFSVENGWRLRDIRSNRAMEGICKEVRFKRLPAELTHHEEHLAAADRMRLSDTRAEQFREHRSQVHRGDAPQAFHWRNNARNLLVHTA